MEYRFDGKKALVTGAGAGIGKAVALKLAECGAEVLAIDVNQSALNDLPQLDGKIKPQCLDLSTWKATKDEISKIGPIDLLVNNAAISKCQEFGDMTEEYIDKAYAVNIKPIINVTQIVAKGMKERGEGGSIVNMSSVASLKVAPGYGAYASSKAAVDQLTKTMAVEYGPYNIRVNSVLPCVIPTGINVKFFEPNHEVGKLIKARTPLRRYGEMKEVVYPILFLLSDRASLITGVVLPVDGGISACL